MRKRLGMLALTLAYGFTTGGAAAQEADVRRAVDETLASLATGDFEAFAGYYHPDARGFFLDGGLLLDRIDTAALQMGYEAGLRADLELRDLDVKMSGDVALTVGYLDGSLTLPGGMVRNGTWRLTETRVPDAGVWKVVQYHISEMTTTVR